MKSMEIKEIVKELEYYNEELPKEALEKAIEYKEEMIPELLKMLEYTKENFGRICLTIWFSANSFKNSSCGTYAINRNDVREIGTNQKFLYSPPFTFKHAEYVFLSSTIKRAFI